MALIFNLYTLKIALIDDNNAKNNEYIEKYVGFKRVEIMSPVYQFQGAVVGGLQPVFDPDKILIGI